MKLIFKQRFFSWFDSYDIYSQQGNILYTVKGQLAWGHRLKIFSPNGAELATVQQKVLTFLPQFELYLGEEYIGCIRKEFSFLKPRFTIDYNGWDITGDFMEWDYQILDRSGRTIAAISKQLLNWTDTYVIDVAQAEDALGALMLVLAIDAEKCSRSN